MGNDAVNKQGNIPKSTQPWLSGNFEILLQSIDNLLHQNISTTPCVGSKFSQLKVTIAQLCNE